MLVLTPACHPGPVLSKAEVHVGGTIAGVVRATSGTVPLSGRQVTATNLATNQRYETTTSATGGYTIQVPEGTYRIAVETRDGEMVAKHPDDTHVNNGDLDSGRDFDVTLASVTK
jgi:hypothetical protein